MFFSSLAQSLAGRKARVGECVYVAETEGGEVSLKVIITFNSAVSRDHEELLVFRPP